jgi:hypothetical protein
MLAAVSIFWHPDPEITFWQAATEPPAGVLAPPVTGDAIEVTGFGDPVRTFLPARALTPEETAEFRREWESLDSWIAAGVLGPPVIAGMTAPVTAAVPPYCGTHRGQCQGCGLDDDVDIWSRCAYCAELAALRARNLPGPPLAAWWYLVPSVLTLALGLVAVWAVLYVIFLGR